MARAVHARSVLGTVVGLIDTRTEYDHLFSIYVPIAIGVFVVVAGAIVLAAVLRLSPPPAGACRPLAREQSRSRRPTRWLLACVVGVPALHHFHRRAPGRRRRRAGAAEPSTSTSSASKWEWTFGYPAYGITQQSGTVGRQPLVVPADEAVRFNLTSVDVIHSFWIPAAALQARPDPGLRPST